jgi:hypothetical protein
MAEVVQTAWVERARTTGGLDHLGVRAPGINIYGQLLPGITNVTDRARYFCFYTWVIWKLDQVGKREWNDETRSIIRKADCLNTLIAEHHQRNSADDSRSHSAATVGIATLGSRARSTQNGELVNLTSHAQLETTPERYFKNPFGGLGQYYVGSLRDMLILGGDTNSGIRYSDGRGAVLARAFDAAVDGNRFWRCIESGQVNLDDLNALIAFCPCGIPNNADEQKVICDILFAKDEHATEADQIRRLSLQLILSLADTADTQTLPLTPELFRGAVYTGAMPGGDTWNLTEPLNAARFRWATYARNEVLAMALQGIFYALLSFAETPGDRPAVSHSRELAIRFIESDIGVTVLKRLSSTSWRDLVSETKSTLPDLANWDNENHEIAMMTKIESLGQQPINDEIIGEIVETGVRALAALTARQVPEEEDYDLFTFPAGYFDYFPLNLRAFRDLSAGAWAEANLSEWLSWILIHWSTDAHIHVALRKLRGQSEDTFRIRPTEAGLLVVGEAPKPEHTNPRFRQARQVLADIGAIESQGDERFQVTAHGRLLMESFDE